MKPLSDDAYTDSRLSKISVIRQLLF